MDPIFGGPDLVLVDLALVDRVLKESGLPMIDAKLVERYASRIGE